MIKWQNRRILEKHKKKWHVVQQEVTDPDQNVCPLRRNAPKEVDVIEKLNVAPANKKFLSKVYIY